jgi:large subunit ribosomal protein L31
MKKDIHPKYYEDAIIHCSCGKVFKMGATKPEMHVEVCSSCHPFYTGQDKIMDSAGRVEKFKKRVAAASAKAMASPRKKK